MNKIGTLESLNSVFFKQIEKGNLNFLFTYYSFHLSIHRWEEWIGFF